MKTVIVAAAMLLMNQVWAFAPSFENRPELEVVLGVDKTIPSYQNPFRFPCTEFQGRAFCEKTGITFQNQACGRTLWVDSLAHKMEISCLINLKKVVIATTDQRAKVATGSRFDYYPLILAKGVSLVRTASSAGVEIVVK